MGKTCGSCRYWKPGEQTQVGSLTHRSEEPICQLFGKVRYEENKPVSWCWKPKKGDASDGNIQIQVEGRGEVI